MGGLRAHLAEHHRLAGGASLKKADPAANRRGYPLWSRPTTSALNEEPEFSASAKELCTVKRNRSAAEAAYGSKAPSRQSAGHFRSRPIIGHFQRRPPLRKRAHYRKSRQCRLVAADTYLIAVGIAKICPVVVGVIVRPRPWHPFTSATLSECHRITTINYLTSWGEEGRHASVACICRLTIVRKPNEE
jgi:hypothetical protein